MQIDLAGAIVGWLVQVVGDSGVRFTLGRKDERMFRASVRMAIDCVVDEVDHSSRELLRRGLQECFLTASRLPLNTSMSVADGLRSAITAEVERLGTFIDSDTRRPFFQCVAVDPGWLADSITDAMGSALRQVVARGGMVDLVHGLDTADLSARLDVLGLQISRLATVDSIAVVHTLPRKSIAFTGREHELQQLTVEISERHAAGEAVGVYAVDGMAGVGKTAFVVHLAHRLTSVFPDGQIFLRLHGHTPGQRLVDPTSALGALLLSTGLAAQQIPPGLDKRMACWRDRSNGKRILLILDDAFDYEQVRALLPESERSLVLVTSRRRLQALEEATPLTLDTLPAEDAVALFGRLASRHTEVTRIDGADEVVRLCGYLPLAIGLVAGYILHHPSWSMADLARKYTLTRDRTAVMRVGDTSISGAFDLSYQNLTTPRQRLFQRLGLHPGIDIDAYAVTALAEVDIETASNDLDELYGDHLIDESVRGRYHFHDLIREHARALAERNVLIHKREIIDRLLAYYRTVSDAANRQIVYHGPPSSIPCKYLPAHMPKLSSHERAAKWFEAERSNLHSCIEYAAIHNYSSHAVGISAAIAVFLRDFGYLDQALKVHVVAIGAARLMGDRLGQAEALTHLGIVQRMRSEYPAAARSLVQAYEISCEQADRFGEAEALTYLGDVQRMTSDYSSAIASLTLAINLWRALNDQFGEAEALKDRAVVDYLIGDYGSAIKGFNCALDLYLNVDYRRGQGEVLNYLGILRYSAGDYSDAIRLSEMALSISRELDSSLGQANALNYIGIAYSAAGDHGASVTAQEQALGLYRKVGNRLGEANSLCSLGEVKGAAGDHSTAVNLLNRSLAIYDELGDRYGQAQALNELGKLSIDGPDSAKSLVHYRRALDIARKIGAPQNEANALEGIGKFYINAGDAVTGSGYLRRAIDIYRRIGAREASAATAILARVRGFDEGV